jgi:hypothetical protein
MAVLITDGFETGDTSLCTYVQAFAAASSAQHRTGSWSADTSTAGSGVGYLLAANYTELDYQFGLYIVSLHGSTQYNGTIAFTNSDGDRMLRLRVDANYYLNLEWATGSYRDWATIATGSHSVQTGWHLITGHVKLGDSGTFTALVDGTLDINFSGDNLNEDTPASIRRVYFNADTTTAEGLSGAYYDDIIIDDGIPDRRVTQIIVEADILNADPQVNVTQELVEVDFAGDSQDRRVAQALIEADILPTDSSKRVSQALIEVDVSSLASASQVLLEVDIDRSDVDKRASQVLLEADLLRTDLDLRVTQIFMEVDSDDVWFEGDIVFRAPFWGRH